MSLGNQPTTVVDTAAFQEVEQLFDQQIAEGLHPGAQLAVYHGGQLVLDLWGGLADAQRSFLR